MTYAYKLMDSPVGKLTLVAKGECLAAILWENDKPNRVRLPEMSEANESPILLEAERQLNEYFAGTRDGFDLALDFQGTEFQKKVWHALLTIPFGETRSYSDIAAQIGSVNAVRAVGAANGRNPISIVAPCHRVIGASGELTGFAGGLANKMFLLSLEAGQTSLEAAHAGNPPKQAPSRPRAKPARTAPSPEYGTQATLFGN
ncbi:methylated-DNA-[protein]-cysteine S-methyltransferase [Paraburkholderia sp. GAS199]|uniref:methylated-DNA--[protein]-cysteine S-methyltransferase n=1 Tax=Paraburkholderia sp. GAS199 TaxID=3035126 RepID=UPI003D1E22D1